MKLSELKIGQKAMLVYIKTPERQIEYSFEGEVVMREGKLFLSGDNMGYYLNPKFDHLWDVKLLN